jgi:hypothetical protein
MGPSPLLLLAACLLAIQFAGCTSMESWRSANGKSTHSAKSQSMAERTADFDADEDDEDDPLNSVGDESRAGLASEEPLDPWFGKYNYADKGRAIERNLR